MKKIKILLCFLMCLTWFEPSMAGSSMSDGYEALKINYQYENKTISNEELLIKLRSCYKSGNNWCLAVLAIHYYNNKEYKKAYPLFLSVEKIGTFTSLLGRPTGPAAFFLGNMFDQGLGVMKNELKAIQHFKKCAYTGDAQCAYNIGSLYSNLASSSKSPMQEGNYAKQAYAWMFVTNKLGITKLHYKQGKEKDMIAHLKDMQLFLGEKKKREADLLAHEIWGEIPH